MKKKNTDWFDIFAKLFCISTALYLYIFILSDWAGLNPEDDRDRAFFGMVFSFFPTLTVIFLILSDGFKKPLKKIRLFLLGTSIISAVLAVSVILLLGLVDFEIGDIQHIVFMIFFACSIFFFVALPLVIYKTYKIAERDRISFIVVMVGIIIIGLSVYPAKNYILAFIHNNPCATKRLVIRQYAGEPEEHQEVDAAGSVVCIASTRDYESETFQWKVMAGADARTFEILGDGYSRDKNYVYYYGKRTEADPKTFEVDVMWNIPRMANYIRGAVQYKKDKEGIYFQGKKVPVIDVDKFQISNYCDSYLCATDGVSIFKEGVVIKKL